jgi:putative tricarboxylic transport membrane protein
MFDAFIGGLVSIFYLKPFLFLLIGAGIGFWVGILPGLGGGTTLALMIPFIYKMTPGEAFPFLLGMHSVCSTTGDMTSILFGIPGESVSVALIQDGYPLTKKGEAGRALGAALMSSLVGALIGAAALTVAIPVVRPLVLAFGTPEMFMITLIGLTCISSLSGRGKQGLLLGMLTGAFGFLCSLVGQDPHGGVHRFTFGLLYMWSGLSLIPVLVGIYAIPEIVQLITQGTAIAGEVPPGNLGKGVKEGIKDTFRHFWLVVRCSILGALVGTFPGVGGGVSQWIAYAQATHSAKSAEERAGFGKGDVRGVLAPGAANNAKEGGALIPTVAFGIPAGPGMAILLGAFLLLGIVPGPDMLTKHLTLTFSMVWTIVVANIIVVGICLLFVNRIARLTGIRANIIVPFLLFLCFIGAYTANNQVGDLIVLLLFGCIGLLMVRFDWPRPPFALGFVLGDLAEAYLYTSTSRYGASWLTRPGVIILFFVAVLVGLYPYFKERILRKKGEKNDPGAPGVRMPSKGKREMMFRGESLMSMGSMIIAVWVVSTALRWPFRTALFPAAIGIPIFFMAGVVFLQSLFKREEAVEKQATSVLQSPANGNEPSPIRKTALAFGAALAFFFLVLLLGFPISVPLFVFLYLKFWGREGWRISLGLTAAAWVCFYGLFIWLLNTPFEEGLILEGLRAIGVGI